MIVLLFIFWIFFERPNPNSPYICVQHKILTIIRWSANIISLWSFNRLETETWGVISQQCDRWRTVLRRGGHTIFFTAKQKKTLTVCGANVSVSLWPFSGALSSQKRNLSSVHRGRKMTTSAGSWSHCQTGLTWLSPNSWGPRGKKKKTS